MLEVDRAFWGIASDFPDLPVRGPLSVARAIGASGLSVPSAVAGRDTVVAGSSAIALMSCRTDAVRSKWLSTEENEK
jgi:hypothetical protein